MSLGITEILLLLRGKEHYCLNNASLQLTKRLTLTLLSLSGTLLRLL